MPRESVTTPARKRAGTAPKKSAAKKTTPPAKKTTTKAGQTRAARAQAFHDRRARPTIALADMSSSGLGVKLMATAHAYCLVLERALLLERTTTNLTVPRLQLLQVIGAHEGVCGAEAARALGVRPQSLTFLLSQLTALGWIEQSQTHGRARDHVLTDEGRYMVSRGKKVQKQVEKAFADAFSHDGAEADALASLLTVGRQHLETLEVK